MTNVSNAILVDMHAMRLVGNFFLGDKSANYIAKRLLEEKYGIRLPRHLSRSCTIGQGSIQNTLKIL